MRGLVFAGYHLDVRGDRRPVCGHIYQGIPCSPNVETLVQIHKLVRPVGISYPQRAFGHILSSQFVLHSDAGAEEPGDVQRRGTSAATAAALDAADKRDSTNDKHDGEYNGYNDDSEQEDPYFNSPAGTGVCTETTSSAISWC